jgi:hypothetical protein
MRRAGGVASVAEVEVGTGTTAAVGGVGAQARKAGVQTTAA